MVPTSSARRSLPGRLAPGLPVPVVAGAFAFGYGLVAVAARFRPLSAAVVMAIPLLPVLAIAVFRDARVGIILVIATFPVGFTEVPVMPVQLVQLAVLVVAALVALRRSATGEVPLPVTSPMVWVVGFCAWLMVALPSSLDPQLALREAILFAIGLVAAAVVVAACRRVSDVVMILAVLLAVIAITSLAAPLDASGVEAAYNGSVVRGRATGIFPEPNQLGTFSATGTLVGVGLAFSVVSRRARALAWMASAVCFLALALSLSRGAWIGFTIGILVVLAKLGRARRALALAAVPLLLVSTGLGGFLPSNPQVEVVGQRLRSITAEKNPYDNRPAIWREAFRQIRLDPLSGQGPGNFPVASSRSTSASGMVFAAHAHNQLLTWASEDGIPAAAFAIALALTLHLRLRAVARALSPRHWGLVAGVAAALVAVLAQGLVDYTLRNSVIHATLFVLLGCAFALDRLSRQQAPA